MTYPYGDYGMVLPFGPAAAFRTAASKQIAKATLGTRLPESIEDSTLMAGTAATTPMAYFLAAYWIAVSARALGTRTGLTTAAELLAKGTALDALPGSSLQRDAKDIAAAVLAGVAAIQKIPGATTNKIAVQAVYVLLRQSSLKPTSLLDKLLPDFKMPEIPKWVPWAVGGAIALPVALWIGMFVKNVRKSKKALRAVAGSMVEQRTGGTIPASAIPNRRRRRRR